MHLQVRRVVKYFQCSALDGRRRDEDLDGLARFRGVHRVRGRQPVRLDRVDHQAGGADRKYRCDERLQRGRADPAEESRARVGIEMRADDLVEPPANFPCLVVVHSGNCSRGPVAP